MRAAELEWRKIEKIDIGKTPELIFARRRRKRLEFFPSFALLLAKPIGKIARFDRARKNPCALGCFSMCD